MNKILITDAITIDLIDLKHKIYKAKIRIK